MLGGMKQAAQQQALQQALGDPAENPQIRAYAGTLAALEREDREAMLKLADALDADPEELGLSEPPESEDRIASLCRAIAAHMTGDAWTLYAEELAPEDLDTDAAAPFAGMGADEWSEQLDEWAEQYRDRAGDAVADRSDRDLAGHHVSETFGVDLNTFETEVVEFEPGDVFQTVVAGPLETHTDAVNELAEREG